MFPSTESPGLPSAGEDEFLEQVLGRSRRLRRRRYAIGSAVSTVLAMVVVLALIAQGGPASMVRTENSVADQHDGEGDSAGGGGHDGGDSGSAGGSSPANPQSGGNERTGGSVGSAGVVNEVVKSVPNKGRVQDPATAPAPSPEQQVAFLRFAPNNVPQIWVMDRNGAGQRQLTRTNHGYHGPSWSPDGTKLAAGRIYNSVSHGELVVLQADGAGLRVVHDVGAERAVYDTEWSNDGKRIAFTTVKTLTDEGQGLYVIPADGGQPHLAVPDAATFDWSPDNRRFVVSDKDGRLKIVGTDGAGPVSLGNGKHPAWSPDGSRIAYSHNGRIVVVNADGSGRRELTSGSSPGTVDEHPAWLDSRSLLFERGDGSEVSCWPVGGTPCDDPGAIWTVRDDGTGARALNDGDHDYQPAVR